MQQCWAHELGGCQGGLSGEHIISESLFSGKTIGVHGLPWCREGHKFIGKAAFTANILCRKHNSELSPVDDAGTAAFAALRMMATIYNNRSDMLRYGVWCGRFDVLEQHIEGKGLERWLLKTLINMTIAGKENLPIGPHGPEKHVAPALVGGAFGWEPFQGRAGLYFAGFDNEAIDMQERVQYRSWIKDDAKAGSYIAAGAFSFFGFRFLLCLEPEGFPNSVLMDERDLKLLHHIQTINVELNDKPSQQVHFNW